MANFQTCVNGHNYDTNKYSVCPYCPANNTVENYDKTLSDFKRTQLFEETGQQFSKTMINEETIDLKTTPVPSAAHPFKRTAIAMEDQGSANAPTVQTGKRKLVGWLATFTHDEYGQDYRLYVGKNKIGSDKSCDIIVNDPMVSAEHVTILFRDNAFLVKDNFSTNGTKVNDVAMDEGRLQEGDVLRIGNTAFKFKTAF